MALIAALLTATLGPVPALAQGVTTAGLTGVVRDSQGAVIPGVTVVAVHQPSGLDLHGVSQTDGRYTVAGMRVGGPYTITAELSGFVTEERTNVTLSLGVTQDISFDLKVARPDRDRHGRRRIESGVQLGPHRRRHGGDARGAGDAAHRLRPHHRHHPPHAAVRRQRHVRRPGQPRQQRHGGRFVLQQLVRAGRHHRRHRRPHRRRADLARSDRTGAGQRRALRRPPGQLHRRRREHRHPQRHQPVHGVGVPPDAQRESYVGTEASGQAYNPGDFNTIDHRRVGGRPDHQEQDVRVRQLRAAERHPSA